MAIKLRTRKKNYQVTVRRGEDTARFTVSPLTPEDRKKLADKHTAYERVKGEVRQRIDFLNLKLDQVDLVIRDWEGVEDDQGQPLVCDRESKVMVYLNNPGVIDEVLAEADELSEEERRAREETEKN